MSDLIISIILLLTILASLVYFITKKSSIDVEIDIHRQYVMIFILLVLVWLVYNLITYLFFTGFIKVSYPIISLVSILNPIFGVVSLLIFAKLSELVKQRSTSNYLLIGLTVFSSTQIFSVLLHISNQFLDFDLRSYTFLLVSGFITVIASISILPKIRIEIYTYVSQHNLASNQFNKLKFIIPIFTIILPMTILPIFNHLFIPLIQVLLGILIYLFIRSYSTNPLMNIYYPNQPFTILLVDTAGTVRYVYSLQESSSEGQITILTNYMNVFTEFIKDIISQIQDSDETQKIQSIEFEQNHILFEPVGSLPINLVLLTSVQNSYIRQAMDDLVDNIGQYPTIKDQISKGKFLDIDELVHKSFQFMI